VLTPAAVAGIGTCRQGRAVKELKVAAVETTNNIVAIVILWWWLLRNFCSGCGEARKHDGLIRRGACSASAVTEGMSGEGRGIVSAIFS
jgi:hypothetical protein